MADYRAMARNAAKRYGLDPGVFERQIQQESGFNPTIRSPAGATGIAQIMPATARGWGVDPLNPKQALNAAAKNMAKYVKDYGGYENALRAYNAGPGAIQKSKGYAETNNYVKTILRGEDPKSTTPSTSESTTTTSEKHLKFDPASPAVSAISSLMPAQRARPQVTGPAAPAFSAQAASPNLYRTPETSGAPPERFNVGAALEAMQTLTGESGGTATTGGKTTTTTSDAPETTGNGKFKVSGPQPERLQKGLTSFAKKVADTYGGTLTGKDGSSHSKLTTTGNVSEHYTGNATDIFEINGKPAQGKALIEAGRAALIAAGMPRSQARKKPGGLYNVGNHQIIFGVTGAQNGGNHMDHLHISTHAKRR